MATGSFSSTSQRNSVAKVVLRARFVAKQCHKVGSPLRIGCRIETVRGEVVDKGGVGRAKKMRTNQYFHTRSLKSNIVSKNVVIVDKK